MSGGNMVLLVAHRVPTFLSLPVLSTKLTSHFYLSLAATTELLATSNITLYPHLPIKSGMAQRPEARSQLQQSRTLLLFLVGNGARAACHVRTNWGQGSFPTCFSNSTEPGFSSFWCVSRSTLCTVPSISPVKVTRSSHLQVKDLSPCQESGMFISRPQWRSLIRNTQDLLLTCGVLKNHTGIHRAPSQGLDHHCHVGDLVPGELLEGCLLTRRGTD